VLAVPSCDGRIHGLDIRNGRPLWTSRRAEGAYHSSPVLDGDTLYAGNDDGRIHAVRARDGETLWASGGSSPVWARPLLLPGKIVFGTDDGRLTAISRKTGRTLWRLGLGRRIHYSDPIRWKGKILVFTLEGDLCAVTTSGKLSWKYGAGAGMEGGPAVDRNTAYFLATNGLFTALDLKTRKPSWHRRLRGGTYYAPAIMGPKLFIGTRAGITYCLDRDTGRVLWRFHSEGQTGFCAAEGGTVFVSSWNGRVYALDGESGRLRWTLKTGSDVRGFPLLHGGSMYIGSLDNCLYAVRYAPGT
jgi:outer membrane protein assembly factor BamB